MYFMHPYSVSVTGLGVGNAVLNKRREAYWMMNKDRESPSDAD